VKNIHTESTVLFEIREDSANGDIVGTGHGLAVPYGTETKIGGLRESFAPGAFDVNDVIGKPLAYRHGEPIGRITGSRITRGRTLYRLRYRQHGARPGRRSTSPNRLY
jgi:hypothetical protein